MASSSTQSLREVVAVIQENRNRRSILEITKQPFRMYLSMGAPLDQKKTKPSLRVILKDFSEKTTAHGINQIYSAKNIIWRTIWILACMSSFGMLLFQATTLLITYLDKPVQTTLDVDYTQSVTFPMVTICNLNIIKMSKIREIPDIQRVFMNYKAQAESNKKMNATSLGMDKKKEKMMRKSLSMEDSGDSSSHLDNVEMDPTEAVQAEMLNMLSSLDDKLVVELGHDFEELIFGCSWIGFTCNKGDFLKYWRQTWNWRYGNCYVFNAGVTSNGSRIPPLTISKPGPMFGLTLDLFINQAEYVSVLSQEAGIKVLLTDQRQIPFPFTHGISVSPGSSASIGVRKFVIQRVDPFSNNSCYSQESLEQGSIYSGSKAAKYSVQGCMNSCLANKQREMCNCTEGKYRTADVTRVCLSNDDVECMLSVTKSYEKGTLGCSKTCPQPCTYKSYRTTISSSKWSENFQEDFKRMIMKSKKEFSPKMHSDSSEMRNNFLRVKIFFDELNLEKITYKQSYLIENLLGDIGGQLGLWIGVSAITCCEFFKLFLDMLLCLWKKVFHKERKVTGELNMT